MADFESKLKKLLALSTSNHDGEALSAIRKANSLLAAQGLDWSTVFTGVFTEGYESAMADVETERRAPGATLSDQIGCLLAEADLTSAQHDLVSGFERYYRNRGFLSERQKEVLQNIYSQHF